MKHFLNGTVKALQSDDPNGAFEVILSAPTVDRDGEVIDAKAFDPLPDHITFDIDHGMSVTTTVGSGVPAYDGEMLKVSGTFASTPLAQEVRTLVTEGHIRSTSVAFMEPKREVKDGVPHIVKAELLNGAFVCIPSNREALVVGAKAAALEQRIPGLKAIEGSYEDRREQVSQVLRSAYPNAWWVYVIATFEDAVVFEVEERDGTVRYRATYSVSDEGITLGAAEEVDVVEVVQPVKDADAETKSTTTDPETPAAPAAGSLADVNVAMAQAQAAQAEVSLL